MKFRRKRLYTKHPTAEVHTFRASPDNTITVDAEIVDSWLSIADSRERKPWDEVESILTHLQAKNPLRARMARMYIRWLRHEALAYHVSWGRSIDAYDTTKK